MVGDNTDYLLNITSLVFGSDASPTNRIYGGRECWNFTAVDDGIKEEEEIFKNILTSKDPDLCFCRDLSYLSIQEDLYEGRQ